MTDHRISFPMAAERESFLAATEFEWEFDVWFSDMVVENRAHTTSSWDGPVANIHWDLAAMDPEFPGTAMLEAEVRLGTTERVSLTPEPAAFATEAELSAATTALNDFALGLLTDAKTLPIFDDRTFREWKVTTEPAGMTAYLNIVFDEPTSPTDTERDAINEQLSTFSRMSLLRLTSSLLRAGVFVRRRTVLDAFPSAGVGATPVSLLSGR
jgi:hypothetical protein